MADAIQNRKQNQEYIRQLQQDKSERKKELAERARDEMRALKSSYQEENQQIDRDTSAAISHIQARMDEDVQEARAEKREKAMTYNRNGETKSNSNERAQQSSHKNNVQSNAQRTKPMVQNYVTKETDTFYKVQDRGSRMTEHNNGYVIEAYAPDHEKDNIRMSVQNNKAVLSGKRKFQDSVDEGNKKISTNNFQTFHEEFKFTRPVASEGMTRERAGDYVRFFIPKLESLRFEDDSES